MKKTLTLLLLLSLNISAQVDTILLKKSLENYQKTLPKTQKYKNMEINKVTKWVFTKASSGRMNQTMMNYFAKNPIVLLAMFNASKLASEYSKEICQLKKDSERTSGDLADAIRHFIWSFILNFELDEDTVDMIQTMQEDRDSNPIDFLQMDLYNNAIGKEYAQKFKSNISMSDPRFGKYHQKMYLKKMIYEIAHADRFYIIEHGHGCQLLR